MRQGIENNFRSEISKSVIKSKKVNMGRFIGLKVIEAEEQSLDQYSGAKNKGDLSKLSGGVDQDGYKVVYEDGCVSWSPKDVFEKSYKNIHDSSFNNKTKIKAALEPYQARVVLELAELSDKVRSLHSFIGNQNVFRKLPKEEQNRLTQQFYAMQYYEKILEERIENF